ncbi:response regulator transcription factor (plasmid) [Deinococcus sp. KNUC1210]|uniref:response regulator transcription factor n=1 Tax=Deinococcus sp. KNUC1210 TaxID=2917691 RepID=UPI001EF01D1C|nr:response regulator transcription factor [Deinococcus sp. KNUC1210]ULH17835.1 response regulator transcription factor [Deinococcus sp. KNUC1210]
MPNVLVVDDDPAILEILSAYLTRDGYQVLTALDGLAGEALLGQADVAVLDWMLPGINGLDLTRRAQDRYPALPILLLTARGEEADRVHGLRLGADDYVVKPFSPREVVARVAALLRRVQVQQRLNLGALMLDAPARRVTLNASEIALSRTEFDLLLTLAQHAGTVLTRDRLLERVWGPDFIGTERIVDVNIQTIRRKLGDDPDAPTFIETVRGVGYRFKVEA